MEVSWLASTGETSLPHHSLDALMIDLAAFRLEGFGHATRARASARPGVALAAPGKGADRGRWKKKDDDAAHTLGGCY